MGALQNQKPNLGKTVILRTGQVFRVSKINNIVSKEWQKMRSPQNPRVQLEEMKLKLLKLKEIDREKLKIQRQKFTSVTNFLNGVYPKLGASAPRRLRERAIMDHTTHHLEAAERRLGACERCPSSGGACADDKLGHRPGLQPKWDKGPSGKNELLLVECDRWQEWISRGRLRAAGVEQRLTGFVLKDLRHRVEEETAAAIFDFLAECRSGADPNLVVAGKGSTPVTIGLLRSLLAAVPDIGARYVRCPQQARPLKQHYTDPKRYDHPLTPLLKVGLLVMVETDIYKADWLDSELTDLIYTRYLEHLPTVIATEGNEPHRLAHHYFRTTVPVLLTK